MSDPITRTPLADLKLFNVNVIVELDMPVFARDEAEARKVAAAHWSQEVLDGGSEPEFNAQEVKKEAWTHGDIDPDTLPYAPTDTACEHGCNNPQRTFQEYMEERGFSQ